jgi:hypothetical protein
MSSDFVRFYRGGAMAELSALSSKYFFGQATEIPHRFAVLRLRFARLWTEGMCCFVLT